MKRRAALPSIQLIDRHPAPADLRREVIEGLRKTPKQLPPKLFYDEHGSVLFDKITQLPEYYLTRTEIGILQSNAEAILAEIGSTPAIIELGSGSSTKVRILLDRIRGAAFYVPVDISLQPLQRAAEAVAADYPRVTVIAVCADYSRPFELPDLLSVMRTIFFPGSNLGNLTGDEARAFFRRTRQMLGRGDGMLIGIDCKKDLAVLNAAYNDSRGVTAEFNLHLLQRINRDLGADFDLAGFEHVAFYNEAEGRIEMHLRSRKRQGVRIGRERFEFKRGEMMHTENSYKYGEGDLERLIDGSGFAVTRFWTDPRRWFGVFYLRVY